MPAFLHPVSRPSFSFIPLLLIIFYLSTVIHAQQAEIPGIVNFSKEDYRAQKQNWQIGQLENGLMVFANTSGLMLYDGVNWALYQMPHQQIVRTLLVDQNRIYVGSYGEFGFWSPNTNGQLIYTSLTDLIDRTVTASEEIWNIIKIKDDIYFHSFGTVFKYDYRTIQQITPPFSIRFMHRIAPDEFALQVVGHGIMLFKNDVFMPLIHQNEVANIKVTGISSASENELLIATEKNGLYKYRSQKLTRWHTEIDSIVIDHQINKMLPLSKGGWAIGTISDGLLIIDNDGKLKYQLNKNSGLQNNTILSLFEDQRSNLWIGLDDGVDLLDLQSPLTFYRDQSGQIGTLFAAIEHENQLFIGTNQGLFHRKRSPARGQQSFKLVKGSQGQVLQLKLIDGQLFCGHNNGTFILQDDTLISISRISGGWDLISDKSLENKLIQGTYTGLITYKKENGQWKFNRNVRGFNEGAKQLCMDKDDRLWVANPYRGLHRLQIDFESDTVLEIQSFDQNHGLPTDFNISMVKFRDRLLFNSGDQYFYFDSLTQRFLEFNLEISNQPGLNKIFSFPGHLDFLVYEKQLEIYKDGQAGIKFNLEMVNGSENLVPLKDGRFLVCLEKGYAIIDPNQKQDTQGGTVYPRIAQFKAWERLGHLEIDLASYGSDLPSPIILPPRINRIELSFASFDYTHQQQFRYQLSGFDLDWSPWSTTSRKEYTNLAPGSYEFKVQYAGSGTVSTIQLIQTPAWYQTLTVRLLLLVLVAVLIWLFLRYYEQRLRAHTRRLQIEKEREINRQRLALQNQILEKEVNHKSQELANSTMNLIQKNKVLSTLKEQIIEIRQNLGRQFPDKQYHQLMRLLQQHMTNQDDWKVFETNFNDVHDNFFKLLKSDYPDLTAGDLKLAAYLKMNLASKEIAPLLNISIRGVENKRYRLRQKMGLAHDENLLDILLRY